MSQAMKHGLDRPSGLRPKDLARKSNQEALGLRPSGL